VAQDAADTAAQAVTVQEAQDAAQTAADAAQTATAVADTVVAAVDDPDLLREIETITAQTATATATTTVTTTGGPAMPQLPANLGTMTEAQKIAWYRATLAAGFTNEAIRAAVEARNTRAGTLTA
jgi:hypothetical protein